MTSIKHPYSFAPLVVLLGVLLGSLGCQGKKGPRLPPATGTGAPEAPQIPRLTELAHAAPVGSVAAGDRMGTGSLQPLHEAALGPKQTGLIAAIAVDEGDKVRKGQVLFRLESAEAQLAVAQAKAALGQAKVQLDSAQLDHERTRALRLRGSIPLDALDQAKSRLDAAQSALEQATAVHGLAQRRVTDMVVQSPIDGVVTERRMNIGETATLMPPSIVLVVQDLDRLELRARLPETALRTLSEQSELTISFPALEQSRNVRIKRIAPTVDARTRTIEIIAEVDNRDRKLKAGMLAEVAYQKQPAAPAPTAEAEAITPAARAPARTGRP